MPTAFDYSSPGATLPQGSTTPRPGGLSTHASAKNLLDSLPILSQTANRALALTSDPFVKMADLVSVIRLDGVLATGVLKMANSVVYRGKVEVKDIQSAVLRVGLRQCNQIVSSLSIRELYKSLAPQAQTVCELLTMHSFLTATLASGINNLFELNYNGEEFVAALLHDIGRVILVTGNVDKEPRSDPVRWFEEDGVLLREQMLFGSDHATTGAEFARMNNLPETIATAIAFHHDPTEAPVHGQLTALVSLAERQANRVVQHRNVVDDELTKTPAYLRLTDGWGSQLKDELARLLPTISKEAIKQVKNMMSVIT